MLRMGTRVSDAPRRLAVGKIYRRSNERGAFGQCVPVQSMGTRNM